MRAGAEGRRAAVDRSSSVDSPLPIIQTGDRVPLGSHSPPAHLETCRWRGRRTASRQWSCPGEGSGEALRLGQESALAEMERNMPAENDVNMRVPASPVLETTEVTVLASFSPTTGFRRCAQARGAVDSDATHTASEAAHRRERRHERETAAERRAADNGPGRLPGAVDRPAPPPPSPRPARDRNTSHTSQDSAASRPPPGESCRSAITASGVLRGATIAGSVAAATSRYLTETGKPSGAGRIATSRPGQHSRLTPRPCPQAPACPSSGSRADQSLPSAARPLPRRARARPYAPQSRSSPLTDLLTTQSTLAYCPPSTTDFPDGGGTHGRDKPDSSCTPHRLHDGRRRPRTGLPEDRLPRG